MPGRYFSSNKTHFGANPSGGARKKGYAASDDQSEQEMRKSTWVKPRRKVHAAEGKLIKLDGRVARHASVTGSKGCGRVKQEFNA